MPGTSRGRQRFNDGLSFAIGPDDFVVTKLAKLGKVVAVSVSMAWTVGGGGRLSSLVAVLVIRIGGVFRGELVALAGLFLGFVGGLGVVLGWLGRKNVGGLVGSLRCLRHGGLVGL